MTSERKYFVIFIVWSQILMMSHEVETQLANNIKIKKTFKKIKLLQSL